jgi:hypothetical protein
MLGMKPTETIPANGVTTGKIDFRGGDVPVADYSMLYENTIVLLRGTNLDALLHNHAVPLMENAAKFRVLSKEALPLDEETQNNLMRRLNQMLLSAVYSTFQTEGVLPRESHIAAAVYFLIHLAFRPLCGSSSVKDNLAEERDWGMYLMNKK